MMEMASWQLNYGMGKVFVSSRHRSNEVVRSFVRSFCQPIYTMDCFTYYVEVDNYGLPSLEIMM